MFVESSVTSLVPFRMKSVSVLSSTVYTEPISTIHVKKQKGGRQIVVCTSGHAYQLEESIPDADLFVTFFYISVCDGYIYMCVCQVKRPVHESLKSSTLYHTIQKTYIHTSLRNKEIHKPGRKKKRHKKREDITACLLHQDLFLAPWLRSRPLFRSLAAPRNSA